MGNLVHVCFLFFNKHTCKVEQMFMTQSVNIFCQDPLNSPKASAFRQLFVVPVFGCLFPNSARAYFFPRSVTINYFCSGPISVDPTCPSPRFCIQDLLLLLLLLLLLSLLLLLVVVVVVSLLSLLSLLL